MKHIMVDIETLDTRDSAVVLSIGLCVFDQNYLGRAWDLPLELQPQFQEGRTISARTLEFWMDQSSDVRDSVFRPTERKARDEAAKFIRTLLGGGVERVWAKGPTFDITILHHYFGEDIFPFRSIRDVRTLSDLAPGVECPQSDMKHNAGDDAYQQARWVKNLYGSLGMKL